MNSNRIRISIITSTLNSGASLQATAQSIREQTNRHVQWIVADGASTDDTLKIINENKDIIQHWSSKRDSGIYNAWNNACKHIQGDWVIFMGAGDTFMDPNVLDKAARILEKSDSLIAYGDVALVNEGGDIIQYCRDIQVGEWKQGKIQIPCHQGVFHHKSLLDHPEPFDESLRICADAKLVIHALQKKPAMYMGMEVTRMILGGLSANPRAWIIMRKEQRQIYRALGIRAPLWHGVYFIRDLIKVLIAKFPEKQAGRLANGYRKITGRKPLY